MSIAKTFYVTSNTGTPLTGKSLILKDRANALPDVPATELGLGHYSAALDEGTAWNVYEGATPIGVVLDALLAQTKEPAVAQGNSAHVYFGNKIFRGLQKSDVAGLTTDIAYLAETDVTLLQRIMLLEAQVGTPAAPAPRTFKFNGKTYSMDPVTVMALQGYREDGSGELYVKAKWMVTEPNEINPYFDVSVPGDGSWVDAFRIKQSVYELPTGFYVGYSPVGLLHNMQSVFIAPYSDADGAISENIDFRFSLLAKNPFTESEAYYQVGQSVIGKFQGSFRNDVGGAERVLVHSIRGIGAQIAVPGVQTKIKVEVRLKTASAPLVIACNGGVTAQLHGQLYPEVL